MDPSLHSPQTIRLSLPQLSDLAQQFLQDHKSYGAAVTEFLEYAGAAAPTVLSADNDAAALEEGRGQNQESQVHPTAPAPAPGPAPLIASEYSSIGKTLKSARRISKLMSNKIVPQQSATSAALMFLNSPDSELHVNKYNEDVEFENKQIVQMDSVPQQYTEEEDNMISSAIGLMEGMKIKGAIPFRGENYSNALASLRLDPHHLTHHRLPINLLLHQIFQRVLQL